MSRYRWFFLDAEDRFRNVMEFQSASDASALEQLRLYYDATRDLDAGFELWRGRQHIIAERAS
jgi:hypothetical protein